jgi:hypothetical protein
MGHLGRHVGQTDRTYPARPTGPYAPAIVPEYGSDDASMYKGGAGPSPSLAKIRYPDWGSYPDVSHRARSYAPRPPVAHMGAVYPILPDGTVSDVPMTGTEVMQAYGQEPIWGEGGDWSGTTLASNIVSSVQAEVDGLTAAFEMLGVESDAIATALAEAGLVVGLVATAVILVEVAPVIRAVF